MGMTSKTKRRAGVAAAMGRSGATPAAAQPETEESTTSTPAEEQPDSLLDAVAAPTAADVRDAQQSAAEHVDQLPRYVLGKIAPHPFNPQARVFLDDDLADLGKNIREEGLHQPLVLASRSTIERDDPAAGALLPAHIWWVVIAGHRRYAGGWHEGLEDLPGLLRTGPCDPVTVAGIFNDENSRRKPPSPLMYAQSYERMRDAGLSTTKIGHRVGVSQPQVSKTLKLLALNDYPDAAAEMNTGRLTRDDAFALLDLADEDRQPVFEAWQADQENGQAHPLRSYALRHTRTSNSASLSPAASETAPSTSGSSDGESSVSEETSDRATADNGDGGTGPDDARSNPDTVSGVLAANPTATVRADLLADAALYAEDTNNVPWRQAAAHAIGVDLPEPERLDQLDLSQATRRKVAVARAVALLDAEAARHPTGEHQPEHVQRHHHRLRALGVL